MGRCLAYLKRSSLLLCLFSAALWAVDPTGTIAGNVSDPSSAAVVGAKVTATNINTGLTREATSAGDGGYVFPLLPVGFYSVKVAAGGFRNFEQRGIEVKTDESSAVPVHLEIGSASQSVTVEANAQMVETQSGALSQVVGQQKIVELPLNGRNAATLVLLTPGTADTTSKNYGSCNSDAVQSTSYPGAQAVSANGARTDMVNYNLDGGSNEDPYTNVNNPFPNPDALEEFSVQTNSYSAEFGRGSGAIVNVVTKSGTNDFHGSAFDFIRNGDLNARNFFAATPDQLKRNQFGGSFGGPIIRNKLFFFGSYQGTQSRDITQANSAAVPTSAELNGDFSSINRQIYNPFTRAPYPNNQIPTSDFAPASVKILSLVPQTTSPDGVIYYSLPDNEHENQFLTRADYDLNKHRIYGRYFYSRYGKDPVIGSQNILTANRGLDLFDQGAAASDTYSITPTLLNNLIFSYNRNNGTVESGAPFSYTSLGIPVTSTTPPELQLSVSGYFTISSGHPTQVNRNDYHISDSVHWVHGAHELAFGGDFLRENVDLINTFRQNAQYTFSGTTFSGNALSDFMLGYAQKFQQGGGEYAQRRANLGSLFIQDNYRAARNLVLNLGLRWDPFVPYGDELGRTECFLPGQQSQKFPNSPTGYLFAGDPGCPSGGFKSSWLLLGPRVGFAYNVGGNSKTTIRGGWGIFYQPPFVEAFNNMVDSPPWSPQYQFIGTPFMNPYQGAPNPFPAQYAPLVPPKNVTFSIPLPLGVSYQPNWHPATVMNWNLTIERQLAKDVLLRVGYVASKGTHLSYNTDLNAPLPSPTATADNEQDRRPYQQFQQLTQDSSNGNSTYNSLQVQVDKRFSHGVTLSANYTWSRSIDEVSYQTDLCGINVINPYDVRAYRGVSDFNVPQRFVLNYLWQLPSPKPHLAKAVLGGWQTSAILSWQSGFPLNIKSGGDYSFSLPEVGNDQAQVISTPHYTQGSTADKLAQWFTTDAFGEPLPNTFGNAGRNILIGPGTFNIDFAAHKVFALTERMNLQFRAEFFNFLNHAQFNQPDTTLADSTFGQITTARDPRIIQGALKLTF
ncbi:MAG TPA: carboxypeptidase regulatory-like domain-containing protein [Bryobacteraceae bacterium]|nr:carboxypeptidase regulatory-like domain-containing protein [Bryobacteraceae bacterium]